MTENKRLFVGRKKVEDRFTIISDYDDEIGVKENQSGDVIVLKHNDLNAQQFVAQLVVFLNDQNQAIVDLYRGCEYWSDKASERITLLEKENEQLKETIKELELENAKHIGDGEWDIRDITYCHGKFRLEEWGERYHQFYDGDKPLEDETVVSLLFENDKLKQQIETKNQQIKDLETRNNRQYERLKKIGDLIFKRDWETLGLIVDKWEKEEEHLQKYGV